MQKRVELIEKELIFKIVGCAFSVINELGHGFREKTYEKALCVELQYNGIVYNQQSSFPIYYRGVEVDCFVPDLLVNHKVIVEIKTVETIIQEHIGQVLNYLRITGIEIGLVLNFKNPKLEWKRVILQPFSANEQS